MNPKTQTSNQTLFMLFLAMGCLWLMGVASTSLLSGKTVKGPSFGTIDYKAYTLLNIARPYTTKVKAVKIKKRILMNPSAFTIVRPPIIKEKSYWPVREEVDCSKQKCIALTFDDGPSENTKPLLELLKAKKARATFFVLGLQIELFPQLLQKMIDEGHEIGNHTYHHKNLATLPSDQVASEINSVENLVYNTTNYRPHIVRPPMGEYNAADPVLANYPIVLWNADPWDWRYRNPVVINNEATPQIKLGSILLLHDIYPSSVEAVPKLIDNLSQQGYVFVTVSELFGWKDESAIPKGQIFRGR
ncbi:MAG TPA: polysaccharide deacetylase family protein [Candidatus Saccharibacteria bacterium]|jgi:peptidoglycan/xylan/chitin deacetylase (PgdA/CDA1 family)|nr:polysaccharide deacetylase family protein [Candidatus Saccharibacteria bacterium]HPW47794.1 polysaccharide deacetylase family protein [Candidatus Saccharibacteria bacterium]